MANEENLTLENYKEAQDGSYGSEGDRLTKRPILKPNVGRIRVLKPDEMLYYLDGAFMRSGADKKVRSAAYNLYKGLASIQELKDANNNDVSEIEVYGMMSPKWSLSASASINWSPWSIDKAANTAVGAMVALPGAASNIMRGVMDAIVQATNLPQTTGANVLMAADGIQGMPTMKTLSAANISGSFNVVYLFDLRTQLMLALKAIKTLLLISYPLAFEYRDAKFEQDLSAKSTGTEIISDVATQALTAMNEFRGKGAARAPLPVEIEIGHVMKMRPLYIESVDISQSKDLFLSPTGRMLPTSVEVTVKCTPVMRSSSEKNTLALFGDELFGAHMLAPEGR
jgi:hypothetical protein